MLCCVQGGKAKGPPATNAVEIQSALDVCRYLHKVDAVQYASEGMQLSRGGGGPLTAELSGMCDAYDIAYGMARNDCCMHG